MANVRLRMSCGCGTHFGSNAQGLAEASKHADTTHHVVGVLGEIVPETSKPPKMHAPLPIQQSKKVLPRKGARE